MNSNGIFLLVAVVLTAVSNCLPPSAIVKPKRVYNMTDECAQRLGCCCGSCMVCCSPLLCACFILSPCIGKCTFKYEDGSECSCGGGYWCQQLTLKSWKLCQFGVRKSWELCKWCYEHCDKCCGRGVNVQHRNGNSSYPCEASPLCDKLAKSLPGTVCICAYIMYLYLHVCTISLSPLSLSLSLSLRMCMFTCVRTCVYLRLFFVALVISIAPSSCNGTYMHIANLVITLVLMADMNEAER